MDGAGDGGSGDDVGQDPVHSDRESMVNPWLTALSTSKSSRGDTSQGPAVVEEDNKWSTGVTHTGILASILVPGAKHLREDLEIDPSRMVPAFTFVILDDGYVHFLQQSGPIAVGEGGICLPPPRYDTVPALEGDSRRG